MNDIIIGYYGSSYFGGGTYIKLSKKENEKYKLEKISSKSPNYIPNADKYIKLHDTISFEESVQYPYIKDNDLRFKVYSIGESETILNLEKYLETINLEEISSKEYKKEILDGLWWKIFIKVDSREYSISGNGDFPEELRRIVEDLKNMSIEESNKEKKLGFGCMRLPMKDGEVDYDEFNKMIDYYMDQGFNYFDTAHGYIGGKSEIAIRECLAKRYPRESFILTNKLTKPYFNSQEDIIPFFEKQLELCGVEYFDFYLMHAQDRNTYEHFQKTNAYEECLKLKEAGKIKHLGISFHDNADMLQKILNDHPEIEIVQIQFNYADYLSSSVQSKRVYEVCKAYDKPVLVMEPVKGGGLVNMPEDAKKIFDGLNSNNSYASYAIRFAASFDGMYKVLSGMSSFEQLKDNVDYMKDFKPLNEEEMNATLKVGEMLRNMGGIPCTACRYCVDGCPMKISIPDLFSCYNSKIQFKDWNAGYYYNVHTNDGHGKASECIKCGACEKICPQHLEIRNLLEKVAKEFE